jgi:anti-sigma28 factor (negative regulator of flagellin synthesis)
VCSRQGLDLKRFSASSGKDLLDEKRLEAIRKKIADGFYDRNDVQRSIVDRLAHSLAQERECGEHDDDAADDAS